MSIETPDPKSEIILPTSEELIIAEEQPDYPVTDLSEKNADYFRTIASTNLSPSGYSLLRESAPASANWAFYNAMIESMHGRVDISDINNNDEILNAWMNGAGERDLNRLMTQRLAQTAQALAEMKASLDNPESWQAWISGYLDQDFIRTAVNGAMPAVADGSAAIELIMTEKAPGSGMQTHVSQANNFRNILPRTYDLIVATSPETMSVEQVRLRTIGAYLNYITTLSTARINN